MTPAALPCLQDGNTPLHLAATEGHAKVVEVLLAAGADKQAVDMVRRVWYTRV